MSVIPVAVPTSYAAARKAALEPIGVALQAKTTCPAHVLFGFEVWLVVSVVAAWALIACASASSFEGNGWKERRGGKEGGGRKRRGIL